MTPQYRLKLNSVLVWLRQDKPPIGCVRWKLKLDEIPFRETSSLERDERVIAISGTSVECRFDARGKWIGTGPPESVRASSVGVAV